MMKTQAEVEQELRSNIALRKEIADDYQGLSDKTTRQAKLLEIRWERHSEAISVLNWVLKEDNQLKSNDGAERD